MTYYDIVLAVNRRLTEKWPQWPVYVDVCPEDFQRPGFWLHDLKAAQTVQTPFLVRRDLTGQLTVFDQADDHYEVSAERLMQVQAAVMDALTPPLPVGDRYVTLGLSLAPRDPGEGSLAFSAEWLDDNIAGQGGEDTPLMEHFAFSFNGEQEKE